MTIKYTITNTVSLASIEQEVYCKNKYNESLKRAIGQAVLHLGNEITLRAIKDSISHFDVRLQIVKA